MGKPNIAVILAGAVAKGAFEAGALEVLGQRDVNIVRIVGASSGSLNATVLASGVHSGDVQGTTSKLVELWLDEASFDHVFDIALLEAIRIRGIAGLSDQRKILKLLQDNVAAGRGDNPFELRLVAAPLGGSRSAIGNAAATTYEHVFRFDQRDFADGDALARVLRAAAASASFPGAFVPFDPEVDRVGQCVDGGIVNNTPVKYALEGGGVDSVVVIAPTVQVADVSRVVDLKGVDLAGHIADMLVNERLYRDLREADQVNEALKSLDALDLGAVALDAVKAAIGWSRRKQIQIVAIRPEAPLPGNAFSGFFDAAVRKETVAIGREAAKKALGAQ